MKTYVKVECTKCLRVGDEYEHIYCQRCMNKKDKELHEQDEKIKELRELIVSLQGIIKELKNENPTS